MQHLDDALIAEWVDGAVPSNSPQHAAIAAHVEQCDECRARVDEERALAGHVRQLLGVAAPPERIPPFEEVLHRAGTAPRRVQSSRFPWRRLAWAATLVVAGGVGWYARGLMIGSESGRAAAPAQTAGRTSPALDEAVVPSGVATQPAPVKEEALAVGSVAARQEAAPQPGRAGAADSREAAAEPQAAVAKRRDSTEARVVGGLAAVGRDNAPPAAPAAAEPRPIAQAQPSAENELRMQKVAAGVWVTATRADAERVLGRPLLTVPALPVVSIEMAADAATVRVRQRLDDGATLELVQSRAAAGPVMADAIAGAAEPRGRYAQVGPPTVEAVVDSIRIVLSAPVSPDSLRVLLNKLRS